MLDEYIPIDADKIPYRFRIKLDRRSFDFAIGYNEHTDTCTVSLSAGGERLCTGIPIRYGNPLFEQFRDSRYPNVHILPYCDTADPVERVGLDNIGKTVKLWIVERSDADDNPYNSGYGY